MARHGKAQDNMAPLQCCGAGSPLACCSTLTHGPGLTASSLSHAEALQAQRKTGPCLEPSPPHTHILFSVCGSSTPTAHPQLTDTSVQGGETEAWRCEPRAVLGMLHPLQYPQYLKAELPSPGTFWVWGGAMQDAAQPVALTGSQEPLITYSNSVHHYFALCNTCAAPRAVGCQHVPSTSSCPSAHTAHGDHANGAAPLCCQAPLCQGVHGNTGCA